MRSVLAFVKKEPVLAVSFLAAFVSCCFVAPDRTYLSYIDFKTLALLFCLMTVVEGLNRAGIFRSMASFTLKKCGTLRSVGVALVLMSFVSSMLITNDVALITFVPFAILVLTMANAPQAIVWVVVVQTIAANMGSMLTPVGNPQNLYLFSKYGLGFGEFFGITAPVWIVSLVVCLVLCFGVRKTKLELPQIEKTVVDGRSALVYAVLFVVCLLVVFRILPWPVMLAAVVLTALVVDRGILRSADYCLLLTFVMFFVFSGNLSRMGSVRNALGSLLKGRELLVSALSSQVISNVPAALLLSAFTDNARGLILGTDIGGLGTPIASMASLIGYKLYCASKGAEPGKFMKTFLVLNFSLLILALAGASMFLA
ncbi:MAG: SLC13 family permease [Clostridia bacterium]|nr:SLC13 family permease [Clostridia bacterium]